MTHVRAMMIVNEPRASERRVCRVLGQARSTQRYKAAPVFAHLLAQPGVGKVTAWTMLALIGDFGRFASGKQLARFCAVTPRNASSGQRTADAGLIRAGDPLLKSVLVEAGHRLRRLDRRRMA